MRTVYLFLIISGSILALPGGVSFLIGIGIFIEGINQSAGAGFMAISMATAIPGIVILTVGLKKRKAYKYLEILVGIITSYRRISIKSIAEKMEISITETNKLVADAVARKRIDGFIDRETDEFISSAAEGDSVNLKKCKACGSPIEKLYLKGETITCPACGTVQ